MMRTSMNESACKFVRAMISLAMGLLAGGGCAVNQSEEVKLYRRELELSPAAIPATLATDPLTLEQALRAANEHNERLSIGGEDYLQALIDKERAAAAFLPTITLAPSYGWRDGRFDDRPAVPVTGRINIFNGFGDVENVRRSAATIEQRRLLLQDLQAGVLLDTARTYYRVLRAEQSVEVLKNSLRVQEERVRDMRGRQKAGTARPLDVAQTEASASTARVALLNARQDVRNGRTVLELLIGQAVGQRELADTLLAPTSPPREEAFQLMAMARRADYLASRSAVIAARHGVDVAVGQYYPSLSLNVTALLAKSNPTDADLTALISANLPIFTAGLIHADVRTAWSRYRQAVLSESLLRRQVVADVQTAYEDLLSSGLREEELRIKVAAADEAFRQADQSYNVGLATNLERITAQDTLLVAQLQLSSEQFDRKVFFLNLLRVTGQLNGKPALESIREAVERPATSPASTTPASRGGM